VNQGAPLFIFRFYRADDSMWRTPVANVSAQRIRLPTSAPTGKVPRVVPISVRCGARNSFDNKSLRPPARSVPPSPPTPPETPRQSWKLLVFGDDRRATHGRYACSDLRRSSSRARSDRRVVVRWAGRRG
jgi:hypothetical protein